MEKYRTHFLRKAPFLKLLPALAAGILTQWQLQFTAGTWWIVAICGLLLFFLPILLSLFSRYRFAFIQGTAVIILFLSAGALLTYYKDIRNDRHWAGHVYTNGDGVVAVLNEPLTEKTKSYKANAAIRYIIHHDSLIPVHGNMIVYFKKDSLPPAAGYGSKIIFSKPLQEINNSGNPDGFDYKRYALFQGITHQVFLKTGEYVLPKELEKNRFHQWLFSSREYVLSVLRQYIKSEKEQGLAEALLIGYKNDLDQSLVQSYTNTGVVHIIAISGLHLGLIYWLLGLLTAPLRSRKSLQWLSPLIIITGLWLFSLLAGAQPSVLRSALMFTCIVIGQGLGRRNSSIYNTLAVSAFLLLCINPFWLWDVGFQLSYAAVLSIVLFMKPIYNWFYFDNKILDLAWKMNAVTLAAQVLTIPFSIYHFHQFPNLFLLTNFVAVPLSSLVVLGEILLCTLSFFPLAAGWVGKALYGLIWIMNTWIERVEKIRYSLWDGLYISLPQTILLIVFILFTSWWLMEKKVQALQLALLSLLGFVLLRTVSLLEAGQQVKVIVYNVPQHQAIDFITGRYYYFHGDTNLVGDNFLRNFHLEPSRIAHRISPATKPEWFQGNEGYLQFGNKKIMVAGSSVQFEKTGNKQSIDLLIISRNPRLYITKLSQALSIKQVVFDGSCPAWKVKFWKKDCDSLQIPWHDVSVQGAFVMSLR